MKRILAIFLCLCILFAGCQNKAKDRTEDNTSQTGAGQEQSNTTDQDQQPEAVQGPGSAEDTGGNNANGPLKLDPKWTSVQSIKPVQAKYELPGFTQGAASYQIADDLSNIMNIDQFSGFTKAQQQMLVNNGFVVLPTQSTKMHYIYDSNEYSGVPNFITSDSILHLYHIFYDKSLVNVESNYLYQKLDLMTKQMLDKSIRLLAQLKDEELKKLQRANVVYFLAARMLMLQSAELTVTVDQELLDLAKQEYALAAQAAGIAPSPLLGHDVDYSQFTVRGHYTRTEELSRFFRVMMWFGIFPYRFFDEQGNYLYDNVLQSLLVTYMTFSESEQTSDAQLWSDIYLPTSQYVGQSDDIDVFTMNSLRKEVFGDEAAPDSFREKAYYDKLFEAVKALPEPRIQGKTIATTISTGKQFRFMGQRYILDSDVYQDLVEPIHRPLPSALDLMGVMGSPLAEQLTFEVNKPQEAWSEYTDNYMDWKDRIAGFSADDWNTNLYTGWLWTLKSALTEYDSNSGMPFFMTNQAWKNKNLNTILGSYAELKHDTVLYGKQGMAEMGGAVKFADYHYVEPQVELYYKLYYLTGETVSVLKERGMLNDSLKVGADSLQELLQLLITCSMKELKNEPLTEEENYKLLHYGGILEDISINFQLGANNPDSTIDLTDMLVSDVATSQNNYLSLGTGYFDDIYVVAPMNGQLYLCRGSVYSYYEFVSDKRLTDEEWWALQGLKVTHDEYADYAEYGEPSPELPAQPEWVKAFKSEQNEVQVTPLEVMWDNLAD